MSDVRVRVVPVGEHRGLGWLAGLAGGAWALAFLGFRMGPYEPFGISKWWMVGIVLSAWIGGTLLSWRKRPYVAHARVHGGMLRAGSLVLRTDHELAASLARASRGFSILLSRRGKGAFVEVESEAEARRLLGAIGKPWPPRGQPWLEAPHRGVRFGQRLSAIAGVISAMLYSIFVGGFSASHLKGVFGFPALIFGGIASVLYMLDPILRRPLRPGAGTERLRAGSVVDAHVRLHETSPVSAGEPSPAPATARVQVLEPAGEPPRAWLERIDALGRGDGGYRGDAPAPEELLAILEDASAPDAARLASARILALRHGKHEGELRARIADEALAPRLRVVLAADPAEAAAEIEASAPLFEAERARLSS